MTDRTSFATRAALACLLGVSALGAAGAAEGPANGAAAPIATSAPVIPHLTLADCVRLALQRQPRVAASRASLAAAEDGYRSLEALRVPELLVPELPTRRTQ